MLSCLIQKILLKAASVADAAAVNPNGTKIFLATCVSAFSIKCKIAFVNGARELSNPFSWLIFFLVVPFNKISLFSKDLIPYISHCLLALVLNPQLMTVSFKDTLMQIWNSPYMFVFI